MLLKRQTSKRAQFAVILASDETEPQQLEAYSLDHPVKGLGRSNQLITDLLQNPSTLIQDSAMLLEIKKGYHENLTWNEMINKPSEFTGFTVIDSLLCCSTKSGNHLLVIPNMNHKGVGIRGPIIDN